MCVGGGEVALAFSPRRLNEAAFELSYGEPFAPASYDGRFHKLEGHFCGCPYSKSPTSCGAISGPLIPGNSHNNTAIQSLPQGGLPRLTGTIRGH